MPPGDHDLAAERIRQRAGQHGADTHAQHERQYDQLRAVRRLGAEFGRDVRQGGQHRVDGEGQRGEKHRHHGNEFGHPEGFGRASFLGVFQLRHDILDHLTPKLGRLCAGHGVLAGDHEGRHAGDAHFAGVFIAGADIIKIGVALQKLAHHRGIEAAGIGDVGQHLGIADVAALDEIGLEERGDNECLRALDPGPVDQAVGVQRVRACG